MAINFTLTITLLRAVFIKFKQINEKLLFRISPTCSKNRNLIAAISFDLMRFIGFRRQFTETLVFFFAVNRKYGKTFLAFLIAFVPINVVFSMWILQDSVVYYGKVFVYFWTLYFSLFLFGIHLILAFCTKHIHRPAKPLLSLAASNQECRGFSMRTRIKLANCIAALHTKRRYGFTYGVFGLVTISAFVKVIYNWIVFSIRNYANYWLLCSNSVSATVRRVYDDRTRYVSPENDLTNPIK